MVGGNMGSMQEAPGGRGCSADDDDDDDDDDVVVVVVVVVGGKCLELHQIYTLGP